MLHWYCFLIISVLSSPCKTRPPTIIANISKTNFVNWDSAKGYFSLNDEKFVPDISNHNINKQVYVL